MLMLRRVAATAARAPQALTARQYLAATARATALTARRAPGQHARTMTHYAPPPRPTATSYKHESIRHSPRKLNLIAKLVRRLWVPDALAQLQFTPKRFAPTVAAAIERCAQRAAAQHELVPEELEIERCFVTPAPFMKRLKIMGRGRSGTIRKRSGHLNVTVAAVDFDAKIRDAHNPRQRRKWEERRAVARAARERVLGEFAFPDEVAAAAEEEAPSEAPEGLKPSTT